MNKKCVNVIEQSDYDPAGISEKTRSMLVSDGIEIKGRSVFVIYCSDWSPYRAGAGTNPLFVAGVVDAITGLGAKHVMLMDPADNEAPSERSDYTRSWRERIERNAAFISLSSARISTVGIRSPMIQNEFRVPSVCMKSDVFIVLPKAKTNLTTEVTTTPVTMLELLGGEERYMYHDYRMQMKLVDVYGIRHPNYVIYDAVVCGEGQGPVYGNPRSMKLMVGGANAINTDIVMAKLMGFSQDDIGHLKLLSGRKAGAASWRTIEVKPPNAMNKAEKFLRPVWDVGENDNFRVIGGKEYYCASGCAGFVRQAVELLLRSETEQQVDIVVGKPIEHFSRVVDRDRTLVVGDCAKCHEGLGRFVPGCPPRPEEIELALYETLGIRGLRSMKLRVLRRLGIPKRWLIEHVRSAEFKEIDKYEISMTSALKHIAGRLSRRQR